jgi:hypothetical protein
MTGSIEEDAIHDQSAMNETSPTAAPQPRDEAHDQTGETILCRHCGRTASNGISCEGACVADSNY